MGDFSKILGHENIIGYFKNAISMEKVTHAYILNGQEKSGKMMLAEAFAMALQCEQGEQAMQYLPFLQTGIKPQSAGYYLCHP